jgi:hypothetical protein
VSKPAWECALLTAVRDEVRAGNLYADRSKRFGRFDNFFILDKRWADQREGFFQHFYRANRELGRIFETEYILQFMSDSAVRQRVRRGLLKGEEIHALARQVAYGKQGKVTARDLQAQKNTASCLTLIMACIIYWQAKEFNRVILECEPEKAGVDLALLEHISPIGWENVLYGEYMLNRSLVRP